MTSLDDRIIPRVYDIVQKYGKTLTFYNNSGDDVTYDAETGESTEPAEATETAKCTPPEAVKVWKDGSLMVTGQVRSYLPTKNLDATFFASNFDLGTRVDWDSASWIIEALNPIYSGDSIAVYEMILKPLNLQKPA